MPVSHPDNIPAIVAEVARLRPRKVMDLGVGFGKFGCLCRETLDAVFGRCRPEQWKAKIYGIEGYAGYHNPAWGLYNEVKIADFRTSLPEIVGYDLVLMIDSLEHVDRETADIILDHLVARNRHVIISVPLGSYPQGAVHGNGYEAHRSTWQTSDFDRFHSKCLHVGVCGVFSIAGN